MSTIWGIRDGYTLRPYKAYCGALEDIPEGVRLRISVDKDRNGKFSSLYHLMLGKVAKAVNRGPATTSIDSLKNWVKIKRGWYDLIELPAPTPTGETHAVQYQSTSFATMGEDEFHRFAVDTFDLIAAELAPWIKDAPEWGEVQGFIRNILPEGAET